MAEETYPVRVVETRFEADDVLSLVLARPDGTALPEVDPGAHIDVHLPNGLWRSYSLSNGPDLKGRYRITVARDADSSGGSAFIHDGLRTGAIIRISHPRNNFALAAEAPLSIFFAGGIGVTPFVPMIARLNAEGRAWRLYYSVRTRARAAMLAELEQLAGAGQGELLPNFDEEPGGAMLDLRALLEGLPGDAHVYCCGPIGMLDAYRAAAAALGIDDARVHYEYFAAEVERATEGGFTVVCRKSARTVAVEPGQTILDAVTAVGINVPFSCEEGVCGSCETRVISGTPDHRDMIFSERERATATTMMICCSGSKSAELVLDL